MIINILNIWAIRCCKIRTLTDDSCLRMRLRTLKYRHARHAARKGLRSLVDERALESIAETSGNTKLFISDAAANAAFCESIYRSVIYTRRTNAILSWSVPTDIGNLSTLTRRYLTGASRYPKGSRRDVPEDTRQKFYNGKFHFP